jgi:hypothetical protein
VGRVEANRIRISDERIESDRILRETESNRIVPNRNFSIRFDLWLEASRQQPWIHLTMIEQFIFNDGLYTKKRSPFYLSSLVYIKSNNLICCGGYTNDY